MKNIVSIITVHNRKVLNSIVQYYGCKCRVESRYPLNPFVPNAPFLYRKVFWCFQGVKKGCIGNEWVNCECLTPKIIYRADVSNDAKRDKKFYFGLADTLFKESYKNHARDFTHKKYESSPKLAKYMWQLKHSNINFSISYSVASKVWENPSSVICQLCLAEKLWIIKFINNKDLDRKSELIGKCRHLYYYDKCQLYLPF